MQNIVESAINYVTKILTETAPPEMTFHNLDHAMEVVESVVEIGENSGVSKDDLELLQIAAIFHDVGWINGPASHEEYSAKIAKEYLSSQSIDTKRIEEVTELILATDRKRIPQNLLHNILRDADILHIGKKGFYSKSLTLRSEYKFTYSKNIDDLSWIDLTIEFLGKTEFSTKYAKENYNKRLIKNILKLEKIRDEIMKEEKETQPPKGDQQETSKKSVKEKSNARGVETMFRNAIRTHVEFSNMADSKANIMISVNTLILTAIVAFLAKSLDTNPNLIAPSAILTLVSLISLIAAITVTRPKITAGTFTIEDIKAKRTNLLFFGNFYNMKLKDFTWGMNEMMKDNNYLYESMITDYYYLGQVLGEKYKKLRICYTFFMYGMVISIIAFAVSIVFAPASTVMIP